MTIPPNNREPKRLPLTEAIERAGPILYGPDWIGKCDAKEINLLKKYGLKPYATPHPSVGRCPANLSIALDRAIGRDARMLAQHRTTLDWIGASQVRTDLYHCDSVLLDEKLSLARHQKNPVGAPAVKREGVVRQMREAVQTGRLSLSDLVALKQEALELDFAASRKVCAAARRVVLAEFGTIHN